MENLSNLVLLFIMSVLIILLIALTKRRKIYDEKRAIKEREGAKERREKRLKELSEDEKKALYNVALKERTAFINKLNKEYDVSFHPFSNIEYKSENRSSDGIITKGLGYYILPKGCQKAAAFFFRGDLEYDKINAITITINGMVSRRFEGFENYMKCQCYDVKESDMITIEIEFDEKEDFLLKDFGILVLREKGK